MQGLINPHMSAHVMSIAFLSSIAMLAELEFLFFSMWSHVFLVRDAIARKLAHAKV